MCSYSSWCISALCLFHPLPLLCPPPAGTDCQAVQPPVEGSSLRSLGRDTAMLLSDLTQGASNWIQSFLDPSHTSGGRRSLQSAPGRSQQHVESSASAASCEGHLEYPEGFAPLRSECLAFVSPTSCPIIRNPFVSPLLAPTELLRGLPPVYIVVRGGSCGLDLVNLFWLYSNPSFIGHQAITFSYSSLSFKH